MKVILVSTDSHAVCRSVELSSFPVILGRGEMADVRIDDRWLSRMHCELRCEEGCLIVRDLASKHGTYVNGQRIAEAPLGATDVLAIGLTKFVAEFQAVRTELTAPVLA